MSIGYACLTIGVKNTNLKTCTAKNATKEKLLEITAHNLKSLENIIDYNILNNIHMFRISSDLIPFGSSHLNKLAWYNIFSEELFRIGEKIKINNIRVSMHPGQYTVINSPNKEVVGRAIEDLNYHAKILDSLGVSREHKIILHVGGVYDDKTQAVNRFIYNYECLTDAVKKRLVIENDDKSYNINDVLEIGKKLNVPVIFDNLHNEVNSYSKEKNDLFFINECKSTWKKEDGHQKIHYSQQDPLKKPGSHSSTIQIDKFINFYERIKRDDLDIMLEVKDKNLSAIKCINATAKERKIKNLEDEWGRYKYKVLENSPKVYLDIRNLLKNKNKYPVLEFYKYIEEAMKEEAELGNAINAVMHVWGYFKDKAEVKEKDEFFRSLEKYKEGKNTIVPVKNKLWKLAVKYNQTYLLESYYFI